MEICFEKIQGTYGEFGHVMLNRPKALNALSFPMIQALKRQLEIWEEETSLLAVIVTSSSEKAFCAGGDIRALYEAGLKKNPDISKFFEQEYALNKAIHCYTKPYISFLNGLTMGGGVGISLHGSHPVAGEKFCFAMPETAIGFFPDVGGSFCLNRCLGFSGIYLGLTGARLSREEAYLLDLVPFCINVVDQEDCLKALYAADLRGTAHSLVTEILRRYHPSPLNPAPLLDEMAWIDEVFQEQSVESILDKLQALSGENPLAEKTLSELNLKSPTSLKVTLKQLHRARGLPLEDCLAVDYQLAQHFIRGYDFYEGVRALIIDKDNTPRWKPAVLSEVTEIMVDKYFEPLLHC